MSDYNNILDENKKIFDYQNIKTYQEEQEELFIQQDEFNRISSISKPIITQQPRYDSQGNGPHPHSISPKNRGFFC